ncbi:MAG TPA: FtsQ-type POTRA domain-containing protein [Verrucomicrobiae bacterium]|nr:FtsQ-type POTRA domain-containing protein [Verrucomicrobiae bacterium]
MKWFRRKPRNRRLGSERVLDVKLRSDQIRATRMRYAAIGLGLAFATIICFYLVWHGSEWALNQLVYENNAFAIQEIDVHTDGVIAPDALRRWSGIKPGQNLFALDLARIKRDLELVSLVRSVAVERVLPHTLRLRVTEREPLAEIYVPQVRADGGYEMNLYHLDREGFVMSLLDPRQRGVPANDSDDILPVLTGINPSLMTPGRRVDSPQVRSALKLLDAFDHSPMSGLLDFRKVDVSSPEILVATTSQGAEITFAIEDLDRQLRRWREIYDQGLKISKAVATLDLSVPNNIPATWADPSTLPPVTPKAKNQQHTRKRNV